MNDINSSFGKGSVTRLGSAGGALVYVSSLHSPSLLLTQLYWILWNFSNYACHYLFWCRLDDILQILKCNVHCSETFPSGCLTLDFALGGGLPKGRIVEVLILLTFTKNILPFMTSWQYLPDLFPDIWTWKQWKDNPSTSCYRWSAGNSSIWIFLWSLVFWLERFSYLKYFMGPYLFL